MIKTLYVPYLNW